MASKLARQEAMQAMNSSLNEIETILIDLKNRGAEVHIKAEVHNKDVKYIPVATWENGETWEIVEITGRK